MAGGIGANNEQIKAAVMSGQRPDLTAITGPETQVEDIKGCIKRCWDQSPENRPSFAGIHANYIINLIYTT